MEYGTETNHIQSAKVCSGHRERATKLFEQGYNCSQSVFAAFCEELGMDLETALKLSSSFGGGMGRLREVCGAVTGMFMAAGLKYGYTDPRADSQKAEHYQRIQALAKQFEQQNGSLICRELLGLDVKHDNPTPEKRTKQYYEKRPCAELVGNAARILEQMFESEQTRKSSGTPEGETK
ncbi:MAG: C-GCAxxG-C-C family protein [Oscillospiraceae bacterium]|nr:C-GCAxxG-C-C family protein [Oscillospiraceae bacterium]